MSLKACLMVFLLLLAAACGSEGSVGNTPQDDATTGADAASPDASADSSQQPHPDGGTSVPAKPGLVIIDAQQTFVQGAINSDINGILQRIGQVMTLSSDKSLPLFITYEDSKSGSHAMPSSLQALVPEQSKEFIKTTFAATGLPAFAQAIASSGTTHLALVGAETDVCVLQTALGLRQMGIAVILLSDAVFSSEPNTAPALKRLSQAGAKVASLTAFEAALASGHLDAITSQPSVTPSGRVSIIDPTSIAVVVIDPQQQTLDSAPATHKEAKLVRLEQLLVVSHWLQIPFFISYSAALGQTLAPRLTSKLPPQTQEFVGQAGASTLPAGLLTALQGSGVSQVVLAGAETDSSVQSAAQELAGTGFEVFLMEDAVLSASLVGSTLAGLYNQGVVPLTHKAFYYGMLKSVNPDEWASPDWLDRAIDTFDYLLIFPEDLPPIS